MKNEPEKSNGDIDFGTTLPMGSSDLPQAEAQKSLSDDDLNYGDTLKGLREGLKMFDRFSLLRQLGRGGMGVVWLGQDERLNREVALKFLPDAVQGDPVSLDELREETKRCLDLTHSNIVRIHDFVE